MNAAQGTSFDSKGFRHTLGTFTTGVTIITTRSAQGEPIGITANSFNSVSLDPPLVLWSLAKTARSLDAFTGSEYWAVHILAANQEDLSNRFARSGDNKFEGVPVEVGLGDVPLLSNCTSRLQCKTVHCYEGGDHLIFVGHVLDFHRSEHPPLVFAAGRYAVATKKSDNVAAASSAHSSWSEDHIGYLLGRAYFQFYERIRQKIAQHGLSDSEYFVLTSLMAKEGRSAEQLNKIFAYTGNEASAEVLQHLEQRDLIRLQAHADNKSPLLFLTAAGRDVTMQMIAVTKAIESHALAEFGHWDAVSLRNLLKQFIHVTDLGLPDPWGDRVQSQ